MTDERKDRYANRRGDVRISPDALAARIPMVCATCGGRFMGHPIRRRLLL